MRKMMAILLGAMVALALAGCAGGKAPSGNPSSTVPSEGTAELPAQAGAGQVAGADAVSTLAMRVSGASFTVALADTEAASELVGLLEGGPVTVELRSYGGFEKVGPLPQALPQSDEQVTTVPGDVMLYQGDQITVFYGSNTWDYTPLGHIEGATADGLHAAFGDGDVTVELSL